MKLRQVATHSDKASRFDRIKQEHKKGHTRNTHIPGTKSNSRAKQQTKHPLLIREYLIDIIASTEFLKLR